MKKNLGILLIVLALVLGYFGVTKYSNSGGSVDVLGVEISAEDNQEKTTSYMLLGLSLVSFIGGIVVMKK